MREDFLHYVWKFKKFDFTELLTVQGESLTILNSGQYLQLSGPDFFNAQIEINGQKWAGNVEIHIKSSDWYVHGHERDDAYNNVILHVVWEHDSAVFRSDNSEIPVLELRNYVDEKILQNYNRLIATKSWIYCEKQIASTEDFILENLKEKLFFERLERKCLPIKQMLTENANDWEAVLFCMLAKNFGLNTNGESFLEMASAIPFSVIRKERFDAAALESLFFGLTYLLDDKHEDLYAKDLKFKFEYLAQKYQLKNKISCSLEFFKHRPDNFPTIRLSQLSELYHQREHLFLQLMEVNSLEKFYSIFKVNASNYWHTHYLFDKESPKKNKSLTKSFIDLLLINTIIPMKFAYANASGKDVSEEIIILMKQLQPEKNAIIEKFHSFGLSSKSAYDSQAFLQLKNEYCNNRNCLKCSIGLELMKG